MRRFTIKENHIGPLVGEIIFNTYTERHPVTYYKENKDEYYAKKTSKYCFFVANLLYNSRIQLIPVCKYKFWNKPDLFDPTQDRRLKEV